MLLAAPKILCDLHFADMALMESSDFMQQLRNFKAQSLGCAVARRKSSTTLIFPLPPQVPDIDWQICWAMLFRRAVTSSASITLTTSSQTQATGSSAAASSPPTATPATRWIRSCRNRRRRTAHLRNTRKCRTKYSIVGSPVKNRLSLHSLTRIQLASRHTIRGFHKPRPDAISH